MNYKHVFFDLDHTLWDFRYNSKEALNELYLKHNLKDQLKAEFEDFFNTYQKVNDKLWIAYGLHKVTKEDMRVLRFQECFKEYALVNPELSAKVDKEYLEITPYKTKLIDGAKEVLDYLSSNYELHIITNGFIDSQAIKLRSSGIRDYFHKVVSSEEVGVNKPRAKIFIESLNRAKAKRKESIMVGDNLYTDILGAKNCGIDQVFYNPENIAHTESPSFEIARLTEIKEFL